MYVIGMNKLLMNTRNELKNVEVNVKTHFTNQGNGICIINFQRK